MLATAQARKNGRNLVAAVAVEFDEAFPGGTLREVWSVLAAEYATQTALSEGNRSVTYAQLDALQKELAAGLTGLGVALGDSVGIWLPSSIEWAVCELACASIGALIVPVNARYRAEEMRHVLVECECKALIMTDRFLSNDYFSRAMEIMPELAQPQASQFENIPTLRHVISLNEDRLPGMLSWRDVCSDQQRPRPVAQHSSIDDEMIVFWTSGSTGRPKGIVHSSRALENIWNWTSIAGYSPGDSVLIMNPLYYTAGNFWGLLGPLLHGCESVIIPSLTPEALVHELAHREITIMNGIVSQLSSVAEIVEEERQTDSSKYRLSLRSGFIGGETLTVERVRWLKRVLGYDTLLMIYGMTELQGFCTTTGTEDSDEIVGETVGRPLPGFQIRICDPDSGETVPPGEVGEALVGGRDRQPVRLVGVTDEQRKELIDSDGWLHTGDLLLQRADGNYVFAGRSKDLIRVGGENVTAAEVEVALEAHPKIKTIVVAGIPDETRSEIVVAFVELEDSADMASIREWVSNRLAPFKQPAHYFEVSTWPRTDSEKVSRMKLQEEALKILANEAVPSGLRLIEK
jgi:fatty-acyl-CoA synthase